VRCAGQHYKSGVRQVRDQPPNLVVAGLPILVTLDHQRWDSQPRREFGAVDAGAGQGCAGQDVGVGGEELLHVVVDDLGACSGRKRQPSREVYA
jgi:hypothetical protein